MNPLPIFVTAESVQAAALVIAGVLGITYTIYFLFKLLIWWADENSEDEDNKA